MSLTDNKFVMSDMVDKAPNSLYLLMAFIILPLSGLLTACEKGIFFTGDTVVKEYKLDPFGEINVNGIFDIELKNDSLFSIKIEGKSKITENIAFNVTGDTLKLSDNNSFRWLAGYPRAKLTIFFPDLKRLSLDSPSKVFSADTLHVTRFSINSSEFLGEIDLTVKATHLNFITDWGNFGYYTLKGYSESSHLTIYGSAQLYAEELKTEYARVRNYSTGDCYVYAGKQLRVWLGHYGNIYYNGSPEEITIERKSSRGRLIQMNPD